MLALSSHPLLGYIIIHMTNQYGNYPPYLVYNNQQINMNYPSLTQNEENSVPAEVNDQEELSNIVQYIKHLKDP